MMMTPSSITIAGRDYRVALDYNTACDAEDLASRRHGSVTFRDIVRYARGGSLRHLRVLVWAALHRNHPAIGLDDVGSLITSPDAFVACQPLLESLAEQQGLLLTAGADGQQYATRQLTSGA